MATTEVVRSNLCPTCRCSHEGRTVHFCECPYCLERFEHDPDGLLARIEDW